jgi:peptidoglycan hydrolase-like protein with peptidoglycan-binding domain
VTEEFIGNPAPLRDGDYTLAARELGCAVAVVRAVAQVESAGGGFLADGRPKILFERHVFHARTRGVHSALEPAISSPRRGGYLGGVREYDRLRAAIALDRQAALQSASWGKFQVMGFNFAAAGHANVERFVAAMVSGEPAQLQAFVALIKSYKLQDELMRRDWMGFARGYNGSAFAQNAYHRKLADAYALFAEPLLKMGDIGPEVVRLQELLGASADGRFGPDTRARVIALQVNRGLPTDGIVGPDTWNALTVKSSFAAPASVQA